MEIVVFVWREWKSIVVNKHKKKKLDVFLSSCDLFQNGKVVFLFCHYVTMLTPTIKIKRLFHFRWDFFFEQSICSTFQLYRVRISFETNERKTTTDHLCSMRDLPPSSSIHWISMYEDIIEMDFMVEEVVLLTPFLFQ